MSEYFKLDPAVFAVDKYYQIMMPCEKACLFFVKIGDKCYYDESNGIMRSRNKIHRVEVPVKELDEAKEYTVCIRPIIERKPYFTETEEILEKSYKFYPIPENIGWNTNGNVCPVVIGSAVKKDDENYFAGCGYIFNENGIKLIFTDSNGKILKEKTV